MRSVIVVPCWRRPEFLAATLIRLKRARGAHDHAYLFSVDREHDPMVLEVIRALMPLDRFYWRIAKRRHVYEGLTYNLLETYRDALTMKPELVYVVEDDVLVGEDFFEFHEAAHELDDDAFCVSACRNQNLERSFVRNDGGNYRDLTKANKLADSGRLSAIYRHTSYQSIGTSHKAEFLPGVLEHACRAYYENPNDYCARVLDDPDLPYDASSQCDLIHRVTRRRVWWTIYPFVPRAFHVGWVGCGRPNGARLGGSWQDSAAKILDMSEKKMNELADPDHRDIKVCELNRARASSLDFADVTAALL